MNEPEPEPLTDELKQLLAEALSEIEKRGVPSMEEQLARIQERVLKMVEEQDRANAPKRAKWAAFLKDIEPAD